MKHIKIRSMLRKGLTLVMALLLIPVMTLAETMGTVNTSSLNLRQSASKSSKALQTLAKGDTVTILGTSGEWYKVNYGKYTGYVMKQYISTNGKVSSSSSSSSSKSSGKSVSQQISSLGKAPSGTRPGDTGSNVKKLQQALSIYGYYNGAIDGDYGNVTANAVKKYQKAKGLYADGIAGPQTIASLFNVKASSVSGGSSSSAGTERLNWFNGGSNKIPKGSTFTVKDCKTGKTFKVKRWSGSNHIDAEPASRDDTKTMKSIYGSWSWNRRPILVKYNGHVYAASMNGMPHGTQTIRNNNFEGHFCIHFYGSKTHGTQKVDDTHQQCVSKAMKYSW